MPRSRLFSLLLVLAACGVSMDASQLSDPAATPAGSASLLTESPPMSTDADLSTATFGAGCFWCVEAVLEQFDGVHDVSSGYMGGEVDAPSYEDVCSGASGHAEVVQLRFDPEVISYETLLDWFWRLHDPTTLNRQGADVGTQYRSAIFVHDESQRAAAEAALRAADDATAFDAPIVTEISAASRFYPAAGYHQDYYRNNKNKGYCQLVISPKLNKLGLDH